MRVVANLDCEAVWAGAPLPAAVAARLALLATTLRVYCGDGDELWLPAAVEPACLPADDFPHPRFVSGARPPAEVRLAWADDGDVARRVNDRRFAAALATALGVALPGARIVTTVDELAAHLAAGGAAGSPDGAWVAK